MKMTPKERVIAALELREPDRVPWGEHFIDYNVFEEVLGRKSLVHAKFMEMQAYWEGRRDEVISHYKRDIPELAKILGMDLITVHNVAPKGYHPKPMEKLSEDTYRDEKGQIHQISSITHDLMPVPLNTAFIQRDVTLEEVQKMIDELDEAPLQDYDPNNSEYEVVQHVVKEMGDSHFIITCCNGLEWPRFGTTEEDSWMNLALEPEICSKIAELQAKQTLRELQQIAKMGVDGVLSVGDLGSSSGLLANPAIYREVIYPWHVKIYKEARKLGLYVLRHCCGNVWAVIDELAENNDAYEGIQATGNMDIRQLKEHVGQKLCLWGGIWHEHIHAGTKEDICNDAKYSFQYAAQNGGYIMGSSHSLAVGAKLENILEMKRCRDIWGNYPIALETFK
jgi:uroporphyrinogen decarboxylase